MPREQSPSIAAALSANRGRPVEARVSSPWRKEPRRAARPRHRADDGPGPERRAGDRTPRGKVKVGPG